MIYSDTKIAALDNNLLVIRSSHIGGRYIRRDTHYWIDRSFQLPIEQFPEIAPPTVSVSASYTGANAETVQKSVVVPLEEALQWSGEYDVHGFIIYEYWICENYNLFSSGYRSRYGDGQCTKSYS